MVLPKHRKDEFCARVLCGGAVVCVLLGHPHRAALNARVGRTLGFSNGWYLSTRTSPPTHTHRHTHTNSFTRIPLHEITSLMFKQSPTVTHSALADLNAGAAPFILEYFFYFF